MNSTSTALKEQIVQAAQQLFQAGVMSHSGHGNISARLPGTEQMLVTSQGNIAHLKAEQLSVVTFDGDVLDGAMEPTAREIIAMHAGVYRTRSDIGAIIHTHSPHVTSFALAHEPLPCVYEALLRFGITEDVPVAAWGPRGSQASVQAIVEQLLRHPQIAAVLLANHGLLAFARDPLQTARLIIAMEESAELTIGARSLGGEKPFPEGALEQERTHMKSFGSVS
jgi:L-ribulose-5-phosphate 4-epimerase